MLEVQNLSKKTLDTNYLFYNNDSVKIKGKYYNYIIKVPLLDGEKIDWGTYAFSESNYVKKDTLLSLSNTLYNNSIYFRYWSSIYIPDTQGTYKTLFLNKNVGFVYWYMQSYKSMHNNGTYRVWFERKLIDFYIAP